MLFAHTDINRNGRRSELLADHLCLVGQYASAFGAELNVAALAALLARVHDFGKCSCEFQKYLLSGNGDTEDGEEGNPHRKGPDHSTAGAQWLCNNKQLAGIGHLLAYAAAGHHAGLPDGTAASRASLANRIKKSPLPQWEVAAKANLPQSCFAVDRVRLASELRPFFVDGYSEFFLVRMLFSCLVDADFLATEDFMDGERYGKRLEDGVNTFLWCSLGLSNLCPTRSQKNAILMAKGKPDGFVCA